MAEASRKVLCIGGDRETATAISRQLKKRGFEIIVAQDGQEGFFAILKSKPDLVLCDVDAKIMSGFEILEHLKEVTPPNEHIPFMFLSTRSDRDIELKGRRLGADDFITKPIDFDLLTTIIDARLAGAARTKRRPNQFKLNDRELEALTWVARGKTSAEIAQKLGVTKRTIDFHIDCARTKLRSETRTEAAIKAAVAGLIKP